MNILNYVNKPTIQTYENLIEYYGKRVKLLMIESNDILDSYYVEKYISNDKFKNKFFNYDSNKYSIYGFPYIGASRNTYLKDSKKNRVKTFEYIDKDFVDMKTNSKYLLSELNYTKNLELAIDLDNVAKLIKSIKNINNLKELPQLIDSIEETLKIITNKYSLEQKCVLYFESDYINILENIQNKFSNELIQDFCKEKDYQYFEIEFKGTYFDILNMIESFGFEKLKYNYENEVFDCKFLGKKCIFDLQIFHSIEAANSKS